MDYQSGLYIKYLFLEKNNIYFQKEFKFKKTSFLFNFNEENFSNKPKLFFDELASTRDIFNIINSKILVSTINKFFLKIWEVKSGRIIRTISTFPVSPERIFFDFKLDIICIVTKKNLQVVKLSNGKFYPSVLIEPTFPLNIQIIKRSAVISILSKSGYIHVLNYQKGCIVKKIYLSNENYFLNGIFRKFGIYCLRKDKKISISYFYKKKNHIFNLAEGNFLDSIKNKMEQVFYKIFSKEISFSNILLLINKKCYLWDLNTRLIILN